MFACVCVNASHGCVRERVCVLCGWMFVGVCLGVCVWGGGGGGCGGWGGGGGGGTSSCCCK